MSEQDSNSLDAEPRSTGSVPLGNLADALENYLNSTTIDSDGSIILGKAKIGVIKDLAFVVHTREHPPPHFHVVSKQRNIDARFEGESLSLHSERRGTITSDDKKRVKEFFSTYPDRYDELKQAVAAVPSMRQN